MKSRDRFAIQMSIASITIAIVIPVIANFISHDQRQSFINGALTGIGSTGLASLLIFVSEVQRNDPR